MAAHMPVKRRRQGDPVRPSTVAARGNQVAHDGRNDAVDKPGGKVLGPLANRRTSAPDARSDAVRVPAKQGERNRFFHGADDLTTAKAAKQTSGRSSTKPETEPRTAADGYGRLRTSRLIDRLDIAMSKAQVSGPALAAAIGIKAQGFTNMRRKPNASMAPELIAQAAAFLRCDLYWLCTGEGGEYVPRRDYSRLAALVADMVEGMDEDARWKAHGMVMLMSRGQWPTFADDEPARPDR